MPPVGPLSLMASLQHMGIPCLLTDTQLDTRMTPFAVDALSAWISQSEATVLAFSVFHDAIPLVLAALECSHLRGRRVFVGGPGVVGIAPRLLKRAPAMHAVVVGEGESLLPSIVRAPHGDGSLRGVHWQTQPTTQLEGLPTLLPNAEMAQRENLNSIPEIAWQWARGRNYRVVPWSTMRGCPFACSFCEIRSFMGRRVVGRSASLAVDDLERAMAALRTRNVFVLDDTFTVNKARMMDLCAELTSRNLRARFEIFSRTDTLDEEMMEALAHAGCAKVYFGLDAGDAEILEQISKKIRLEEAVATIRRASTYFEVVPSFIWGYPFESWKAFQNLLDLAGRLVDMQQAFPIMPHLEQLLPSVGTSLFHQYRSTLFCEVTEERYRSAAVNEGGRKVLDIIERDAELGAAFYRYRSPELEAKRIAVETLRANILGMAG